MTWVEGTAAITASDPQWIGTRVDAGNPYPWEMVQWRKHKYRFQLEVRLPGRAPYQFEGKFRVPRKAERVGLFQKRTLQAGITLPVRVRSDDPGRVEVDWDRFAADPDHKAMVQSAHDARRNDLVRQQLERNPKAAAQARERNRIAVASWVEAVRHGGLSRAEFDRTVDLEVATGRMDPAHAEWARQTLDG